MAVYRNFVVDIPKRHVTIEKQSGGKPALVKYVLEAPYDRQKGYARPRRTTIGHQCVDSKISMHPTSQYANIFPSLWEQISNQTAKPVVKKFGLYAACQAINSATGIKDILDRSYGVDRANAIMDYAVGSLLSHSNEASCLSNRMDHEMVYSKEMHSDSYYSRLFEEAMTYEQELQFRRSWALSCKKAGVDSVWLCIDGSNDDCQSTGVEIAEKGHAKSGKNINIVSFTYAVSPQGLPITYDVYRGGLVDAKAMKTILDFLADCGMAVQGVILDRGYCNAAVLQYLNERKISYVIMVKGQPQGYEKAVKECAHLIKMNAAYLIPHTYLFGCQRPVQLFNSYKHLDYLTIFYDYRNGSERITALLKSVYEEMSRLEQLIKKDQKPVIDKKYQKLLDICFDPEPHVQIKAHELQPLIEEKGLYSIVTSSDMEPRLVHELYSSRNSSEIQYRLVKTQLGYGTLRVHCTASVRSRFTLGFISSILRYEIEMAAKKLDRHTNQMIYELEQVEAKKLNNVYTYSHLENERLKEFFRYFKTEAGELIDASIKFENDRIAGRVPTPRRRKTGPRKGSHHKKFDEKGNVIFRKPGVKKGTKRKAINKDGQPRKKPGVKLGTKRGLYNKNGTLRKKPGPKTIVNATTMKINN